MPLNEALGDRDKTMNTIEPYLKRPVKFLKQVNSGNWRIKVYGISAKSESLPDTEMENGGRMKFFEMIRKTTIVQKILIGGSIVWILWEPRGLGDFVEGLILIVIVLGLYWIIIEIMRKRKKESEDTENK